MLCEPSLLDHANVSVSSFSVDNEEVEAQPLDVVLSADGRFSRCAEENCVVQVFLVEHTDLSGSSATPCPLSAGAKV